MGAFTRSVNRQFGNTPDGQMMLLYWSWGVPGSHLHDVSNGVEALAARRVCVQAVSGYTGPLSWWAW